MFGLVVALTHTAARAREGLRDPARRPDAAARRRRRARAGTLVLTGYAARATRTPATTTSPAAASAASANGLALAGDQISAASFLGITGAIALTGFNGF